MLSVLTSFRFPLDRPVLQSSVAFTRLAPLVATSRRSARGDDVDRPCRHRSERGRTRSDARDDGRVSGGEVRHREDRWPEHCLSRGLLAYGPNLEELNQRAAGYVDKIRQGARPGDLPVEQPAKFDLVVNIKTAEALGIRIPQQVLLRADSLIQ